MAHKTFISYKYNESRELRDKIIFKLRDDAFNKAQYFESYELRKSEDRW